MAEKEKGKQGGKAKAWFENLQAEFRKIIWPDVPTLIRQTIAVVVITTILGGLISIFDAAILEGINLLVK